ncbi:hypothetical protein WR25_26628 [Diploscapter pachys]|uniref:7TM GPCR serpentine receptor class x (Srx) domain-containing protein n=1 Tax=Diploscapter pachys TaxID=2018661 RepID=A0A2A2LBY0_9BILA|nr:hypothetical protein WR25_26628 [Diploscapter pachys]
MERVIRYGGVENVPNYNCSEHTSEEWSRLHGEKHPIAGFLYLVYGIIIVTIYVPCLKVITSKELFRLSCFKIMSLLGLVDLCEITVGSIIHGFLMIEGAVYCSYPNLIYPAGSLALFGWCSACMICLILVINRVLDILYPSMVKMYFKGYRTYLILSFPIMYGLYFAFFTPTVTFHSPFQSWFFDPFINNETDPLEYANIPHSINNLTIVFMTCFLYLFLCISFYFKVKGTSAPTSHRLQKSIFIQSTVMCMVNLIASTIYVLMQFIPVPPWLNIVAQITWQGSHGAPAITYITLNRTIRTAVLRLLRIKKNSASSSHITPASNQTNSKNTNISHTGETTDEEY